MRKILQGMALFAAVFAFGSAADAQINYRAEVNIPFDFSVGEKAYQAGEYTVKINRQMAAGAVLTIQRNGTDEAQSVLMSNYGGDRSDEVQLIFSSIDGLRQLTGVVTSNSDFALRTKNGRSGRVAKVKVAAASRTRSL